MIKRNYSLLAMALLLSGCASKPLPPTSKLVQSETITSANSSQITIEAWNELETDFNRPTDNQLRYVTQGDTSKVVALKTLQFVTMMFTTGGQATGFTKSDLKGTEVKGLANPSVAYLMPRVSEILKTEMDKHPAKKYPDAVKISPYTWKLIYKNLAGGDDNYELIMTTALSRATQDKDGKSLYTSIVCGSTASTPQYTLPQWRAHSYAKVTEVTQQILDDCITQFTNKSPSYLL
ncbi:hypothetical protein C7431_101585 [Pantoea allii]|uniref:Lipoprotein n=3 Tax=Pantoea allii TaxID=574096 RepID=A0A2V2BNV6_9GAMM|nr:hypothetical protein C7431_101585 [Pantoea allii]